MSTNVARDGLESADADHVVFQPLITNNEEGSLTGSGSPSPSSGTTGRHLTFHSPNQNKTWEFTATHHRRFFEMVLGPDGIGIGGSWRESLVGR